MNSLSLLNPTPTRSSTPASQQSGSVLDAASHAQSSTQASTPPTMEDTQSVSSMTPNKDSDTFKVPPIPAAKSNDELNAKQEDGGRERRRRSEVTTYNLKVLSGTAVHSPFTKNGVRKATRDRLPQGEKVRVPRVRHSTGNLVGASASTIASADNPEELSRADAGPVKRQKTTSATPKRGRGRPPKDPGASSSAIPTSQVTSLLPQTVPTQQSTPSEDSEDESEADEEDDDFEETQKGLEKESGRRQSTRLLGVKVEPLAKQVLGKRSRAIFDKGIKSKRELLRLLDTKEYAGIDDKPVIHEVWSNGKLVSPEEKPKKKPRGSAAPPAPPPPADDVEILQETAPVVKKKVKAKKVWLDQGLYVGDQQNRDWFMNLSENEKRNTPNMPTFKPTGFMPLPMWLGQRLLHTGRNFKLPFDVCSPLAPGQPKPDGWKALMSHRKNHLVGDAAALWKDKYQNDDSKCICSIEDGCGEGCHNREMMYECDSTNCNVGAEHCTNRSWAELERRRDPKKSNIYTIGVEVFKTEDRGFGVRSNRCFEPNQIIVEYTGEIITEEECDRRMNEVYKNNDCYYLMSYEQNMILDATKGSIARFVNHSCNPNCNMVKWVVKGKPRIALFALDRPIMTGEELTYDYNFNPFAANNVQECRCGSENCRGIVGPRPKGPIDRSKLDMVKNTIKAVKAVGTTTKRKLKELIGQEVDDTDNDGPSQKKKRKVAVPKTSRTKSSAPAFAASVHARLANASKAIFGAPPSPSGRAQRALNKDSGRNIASGLSAARGSATQDSTASETSSAGPLQIVGKKGRLRTLITNADGSIALSKDGKRKTKGWGGDRQKAGNSASSESTPAESSKASSVANVSFKTEESGRMQARHSVPSLPKAFAGRPMSSSSLSSAISHHPNVGEARIGTDEERDAFVSGTIIRRVST